MPWRLYCIALFLRNVFWVLEQLLFPSSVPIVRAQEMLNELMNFKKANSYLST